MGRDETMTKRIMIADDSATMRQLVSLVLKESGYTVVEAIDGRDAFRKLRADPVDMIITDVNMPNMDGITLVREVRAQSICRFIPIIVLTTEGSEAKKQEGQTAGATGWIVKPFNREQLQAVVRKVLG
jgi:two-component system chemotaxis response regulator CheY